MNLIFFKDFSIWDKIKLKGPLTFGEIFDFFEKKQYNIHISAI